MQKITFTVILLAFTSISYCMERPGIPEQRIILSAPTGSYPAGTAAYHFIDKSRKELRSENPADNRELMVYVWYPAFAAIAATADKPICVKAKMTESTQKPAQTIGEEPKSRYVPAQAVEIIKRDINQFVGISLEKLNFLGFLTTHAIENAPVSPKESKYPLIIFSPGFGSPVQLYTTLFEDLASHGYIVAAINHPYISNPTVFPDGRVIERYKAPETKDPEIISKSRMLNTKTWIEDTRFVIDQFEQVNKHDPKNILTGKIDLERIGVFGHSFGGTIAIDVCGVDARCKAGIDIDGKPPYKSLVPEGFDKPFMFVIASKSEVPEIRPVLMEFYKKMGPQAYYITVQGAEHGSFGDFLFIAPTAKMPDLSPKRGVEITRALLVDFFNKYLKGQEFSVINKNVYSELAISSK